MKYEDLIKLENGDKILELVIPGRPATKKTSQRIVRRGRHIKLLPSERYVEYEKHCQVFVEEAWKLKGHKPIACGIGIKLSITLNSWVLGDETGYMQAFGDILEKFGLIANDQLIHWMGGDEHMIQEPDKENPKAKIEIFRFRHPQESRPNFDQKFNKEDEDNDEVIVVPKNKRKTTKKAPSKIKNATKSRKKT